MLGAGNPRHTATNHLAIRMRSASIGVLAVVTLSVAFAPRLDAAPLVGIHNIQHVVMIMQENRSFDSYFGTYPGANRIPAGVCVPLGRGCVAPFHNPSDRNSGGPHGDKSAVKDINGGLMNGFAKTCSCSEVMGYHDAREIPNYWTYAKNFVLQDNMFESVASGSLAEHLDLVSGWSAECKTENPMQCSSTLQPEESGPYAWTDITYLLDRSNVSWSYYIFKGTEPDCESDEAVTCKPVKQGPTTGGIWNPLRRFTDVKQDGQSSNIRSLTSFYEAVHQRTECGLSNVSWVVPNYPVSEHPPALISEGQAYVTTLINSIMRSPCWDTTAIFLSWDDWGGLYDHVVPPNIDQNGYGLRVPGVVISPYAKKGYIDHQQLSHDAYLKFIEEDFLKNARLNPATDGRPDARPNVREEASGLGDLVNDFDFNQSPRPPLLLSTHPEPGPASEPPGSHVKPILEMGVASSLALTSGW
jgi:phospholipase C